MTKDERDERNLRDALSVLKIAFEDAAKPIIDRLVRIENRKTPKPFMLPDGRWMVYNGPDARNRT